MHQFEFDVPMEDKNEFNLHRRQKTFNIVYVCIRTSVHIVGIAIN